MCYIRKYYNRVIYWSCNRDNHVLLLIRDNANENLIDKVRIMMNYSKMQKKYYYEYFNVYDPKKENTMETKE